MATSVRQKKGYLWLVLGVNQRKVLIIWIFKDKVKLYKDFCEKFFFDLSSPLKMNCYNFIGFQDDEHITSINCNHVYTVEQPLLDHVGYKSNALPVMLTVQEVLCSQLHVTL